ncbi:MAG: hypothetical protein JW821_04430 [Deltaproteobacteria bacterium]|nr:hypothetical protein [Deltaproteobacteria bacterium]
MRDFNDKDRKRKTLRIQLGENPADLPAKTLAKLESAVAAALKDGYLRCPVGWKIAKDLSVPRIAVGPVMDKLGARVTDCQLGFFKVDKTPYPGRAVKEPSPEMVAGLRELDAAGELVCPAIFKLARRLKTTPRRVSEAANILGLKIRGCQLGCF